VLLRTVLLLRAELLLQWLWFELRRRWLRFARSAERHVPWQRLRLLLRAVVLLRTKLLLRAELLLR
jgi:hypothetical protein